MDPKQVTAGITKESDANACVEYVVHGWSKHTPSPHGLALPSETGATIPSPGGP